MNLLGNCGDLMTAAIQIKNAKGIQSDDQMPTATPIENFEGIDVTPILKGGEVVGAYEIKLNGGIIGHAYKVSFGAHYEYVTATE